MANTNGKKARKKIGGNRFSLKRGSQKKQRSTYAEKRKRWFALERAASSAKA